MRIVLFGPPGAGKGTQAEMLVERYQLRHISTGEIIRTAIYSDSELGREAKKFVNEGGLLPGYLVRQLAEQAIAEAQFKDFVLDGYPRTVEQAEWLTEFLESLNHPLHAVISIEVSDETVINRLSKRRVNKLTGESYHLEFKPPPVEVDPNIIVQRPDDQPAAIKRRLRIYYAETRPVQAYYEELCCFYKVNGEGRVEDVFARIQAVLRKTVAPEDLA